MGCENICSQNKVQISLRGVTKILINDYTETEVRAKHISRLFLKNWSSNINRSYNQHIQYN